MTQQLQVVMHAFIFSLNLHNRVEIHYGVWLLVLFIMIDDKQIQAAISRYMTEIFYKLR